ncbi:hypothetical protein N7475_010253 [Penicillium sp. IBT 31633x]|nr:hypothetical protein N7475_010253 [Penicillium sp. IBT 31633x]
MKWDGLKEWKGLYRAGASGLPFLKAENMIKTIQSSAKHPFNPPLEQKVTLHVAQEVQKWGRCSYWTML